MFIGNLGLLERRLNSYFRLILILGGVILNLRRNKPQAQTQVYKLPSNVLRICVENT